MYKKSIDHHADRISSNGIVVIDDITELPIYGQPFASKNYVDFSAEGNAVDIFAEDSVFIVKAFKFSCEKRLPQFHAVALWLAFVWQRDKLHRDSRCP